MWNDVVTDWSYASPDFLFPRFHFYLFSLANTRTHMHYKSLLHIMYMYLYSPSKNICN